MQYRFVYLLLLLGICVHHTVEWDLLLNVDDDDKLLCHACKGKACAETTNDDQTKVLCNKRTQLCWAGYVDEQPYRTCASRYCTPSDFSLDSDVRIELCCRTNLCNSISLSKSMFNIPLYSRMVLPSITESSKTTTTATTESITTLTTTTNQMNATKAAPDYFIGEERAVEEDDDDDELVPALDVSDLNSHEEINRQLPSLSANKKITWEYLPQDKNYNNGVASISNLVLFLIPLLFVLLF
ncbi:unnamed protein product [Adineta ricciae]|uniref:Uncharacterized protein n=1 Tax=Adineta ricciae TaxID=249248 RepID=A0A814FBT8_ADIRI|nr:unnamed protein product [Adineta ricciae]CAF1444679.1 unnamed protein product [Adineta ricciae]